jgi:hypothetical protein
MSIRYQLKKQVTDWETNTHNDKYLFRPDGYKFSENVIANSDSRQLSCKVSRPGGLAHWMHLPAIYTTVRSEIRCALTEVLEVTSTSVDTGLNPFKFYSQTLSAVRRVRCFFCRQLLQSLTH